MERRVRTQRRRRWDVIGTRRCPVRCQRDRVVFRQRIRVRVGSLFSWFFWRFRGRRRKFPLRGSSIGCFRGIAVSRWAGLRSIRRLRRLRGLLRPRSAGALARGNWPSGEQEPVQSKGQPKRQPCFLAHDPKAPAELFIRAGQSQILASESCVEVTIPCCVVPAAYAASPGTSGLQCAHAGHDKLPLILSRKREPSAEHGP
jgi:hypothetical protein